jgi:hypothetical protein
MARIHCLSCSALSRVYSLFQILPTIQVRARLKSNTTATEPFSGTIERSKEPLHGLTEVGTRHQWPATLYESERLPRSGGAGIPFPQTSFPSRPALPAGKSTSPAARGGWAAGFVRMARWQDFSAVRKVCQNGITRI